MDGVRILSKNSYVEIHRADLKRFVNTEGHRKGRKSTAGEQSERKPNKESS